MISFEQSQQEWITNKTGKAVNVYKIRILKVVVTKLFAVIVRRLSLLDIHKANLNWDVQRYLFLLNIEAPNVKT